jgi:hypothetical protein
LALETFAEALERAYPRITWRLPMRMASPEGTGLGCRFCIARHGIKAHEIPALPQTISEFHSEMKDFHNGATGEWSEALRMIGIAMADSS